MPRCSKCCRCSKYMWLIGFQILLIILFMAFVRHDSAHIRSALAMSTLNVNPADPNFILNVVMALLNSTAQEGADVPGFEGTHFMIYVGFGFLTTFLMKYCYSALGISMLLAALVAQWSIFTRGVFYMKKNIIFLNKTLLIRADFMSAAVLITFGTICGHANVNQLLFIAIIEAAVGSANLYFLESVIKISDVGGAIGIHLFGAFFGMCVSSVWNCKGCHFCKSESAGELHPKERPNYMSDIMSMMGTLFLFVYWPIFNSAQTTPSLDEDIAIANTYIAIASCTVTTFALSSVLHEGKFGMEHIQNSTLAGGVAVGAVANMHLQPYGAILIGLLAAVISVYGISKLKIAIVFVWQSVYAWGLQYVPRINATAALTSTGWGATACLAEKARAASLAVPRLTISSGALLPTTTFRRFLSRQEYTETMARDLKPCLERYGAGPDTRNVMFLHGLPGFFSGIVSVVLALMSSKDLYGDQHLYKVFPAMKTGRTSKEQATYQLLGIAVSVLIATIAGSVCGGLTKPKCFKPLKKEHQFDDVQYWELPK